MGRGRHSKLTPDVRERICDAIRAGNYYIAACRYGGIDYSTFRLWMKQGEADAAEGKRTKYFLLFEEVLRAEVEAEIRTVANWQKAIPEDWRAARDFLARRHPERWGPKTQQDLYIKGELDVDVDLEKVNKRLEVLLAKKRVTDAPEEGEDQEDAEEE